MKPISFECPHCHEHIAGDESMYGEEVKCPKCQAAILAPSMPVHTEPQTARLITEPAALVSPERDEATPEADIFTLSPVARAFPGRLLLGMMLLALAVGLALRAPDFSWPQWVAGIPLALGLLVLLIRTQYRAARQREGVHPTEFMQSP